MAEWLPGVVAVVQLVLNGAAIISGAAVWKLYVGNLKAAIGAKDAAVQSVEKSRDFWKEKAEDLERRSPEVLEKSLAERIEIRDNELARIKADQEFDKLAVRTLEMEKAQFEQDLLRTQGFRAMLAIEDRLDSEAAEQPIEGLTDEDLQALAEEAPPERIEVTYIGEVGVDSGQLMVTDPCYIDQEWTREKFSVVRDPEASDDRLYSYSYNGACNSTLNGEGHGQLAFQMGHAGAGVAFQTAWGDGAYAVYAEKHDGRIVRVYVNVG